MERIAADPCSLPTYDDASRYLKLRTLPYMLIFRVKQDEAEVLAFAHVRRKPGYWRGR